MARSSQTLRQLKEPRAACFLTLEGRIEGTKEERITYNLKAKVPGKKFYLLSVTLLGEKGKK